MFCHWALSNMLVGKDSTQEWLAKLAQALQGGLEKHSMENLCVTSDTQWPCLLKSSLQNLAGVPFMVSHTDQGTLGCEDHAPFQLMMCGAKICELSYQN